jgi:hypothetical protein
LRAVHIKSQKVLVRGALFRWVPMSLQKIYEKSENKAVFVIVAVFVVVHFVLVLMLENS